MMKTYLQKYYRGDVGIRVQTPSKVEQMQVAFQDDIKNHFNDILEVIKQEKTEIIATNNKLVETFSGKLTEGMELVHSRIDHVRDKNKESTVNLLDGLVKLTEATDKTEVNVCEKVDNITEAIRGIKVEPIVNVEKEDNRTVLAAVQGINSGISDVKEGIIEMKKEIVKEIKSLKKPNNYNIEFSRDYSGFLKSPIKIIAQ